MLNAERLISVLFEAICSWNIPTFLVVLMIFKSLSKQENCLEQKEMEACLRKYENK